MGASRKLQGEIDRVLKKVQEGVDVFDSIWNKVYDTENVNQKEKFEADLKKEIKKLQRYRDQIKTWIQSSEIKDKKVSASYEQALMDARKLIEREMERFKVCEKETKTKAFSKEGLGQQPKTDPKEKAKSETRDWLNNVVGDLETQIDHFEAEMEGLSVKKGKTRPPRLTHLETSITRHKAHVMKSELILRLLDNDELSPDQVNDVKDFLEDYVERNQEDFDEFSDVDELYVSLPLDKVEALEDLVSLGPSSLTKIALSSAESQHTFQDQGEDAVPQESNSDATSKTLPSTMSLAPTLLPANSSGVSVVPTSAVSASIPVHPSTSAPTASVLLSGPPSAKSVTESSVAVSSSLPSANSVREEDTTFPGRRPSPAIPEIVGKGISRGISNPASISTNMAFSSASAISENVTVGSVPALSDISKPNSLNVDERIGSELAQPLVSPINNRILLQSLPKTNDGTSSNDSNNVGETPISGGRVFSPSLVPGVQWRAQGAAFQNANESGQFRGRPEIAPDQREKFLQRLQQVQQGHSNLLNVSHISGANHKQFTTQQQSSLLQQFSPQNAPVAPHITLGLGVHGAGFGSVSPQQQPTILQQSSQHPAVSSGMKDGDAAHANANAEDQQQQWHNMSEDLITDPISSPSLNKIIGDDDLKTSYTVETRHRLEHGPSFPWHLMLKILNKGQFRGRPEIAPDQREKFLQRLQQVQQGHSNLLNVSHISGANHKQFTTQQQSSLLQQFSPQNAPVAPHITLGLGVHGAGFGSVSPQQQPTILQQSSQHPAVSSGMKDGDAAHANANAEDQQQQWHNMSEDLITDPISSPSLNKIIGDDDLKTSYTVETRHRLEHGPSFPWHLMLKILNKGTGPASAAESSQLSRENEMSLGQPLQAGQSSASLGVIGRRSALDLGAIGDNINGLAGNSGGMHDQIYNLQMLEAAYYKLPQSRDSERAKTYVPIDKSYPQTQAPIIDNPAFWERSGLDPMGTDALFFAFYYQQNTPQQYLAARELKRQFWRFHKKFNTWFQRHEEPKVTNDNFERGNYVYFDFHIANDGSQHGWCQRIKTDFTFEYDFLEDELVV
ncbi:hypothetical protein ZIOFF_036270 [Zingiber officinale]|uniref:CCR4-NOT transcription complex subunit 3 n=1 Tax=Zingiber officinale TaxID=94328 RepID=A0A8J5GB78_ZINOF|nr:hypothetical protein ZIOFF_036270 [Zingiber officinale]